MIKFLADNIDQMDLALDWLIMNDCNYDRFALILIDNVIELTLHKYAEDKAAENQMWIHLEEPIFDPKDIQDATGRCFNDKAKFAAKTGLIDNTKKESILKLHSYRNIAYHKGLRHERILHSLSIFYFINACEILKSYSPPYWSWDSGVNIPYRARKYLGNPRYPSPEDPTTNTDWKRASLRYWMN